MGKVKNNIAKFLNLEATPGNPIELFDSNGNEIYYEGSLFWIKREFDSNNNQIYFEKKQWILV